MDLQSFQRLKNIFPQSDVPNLSGIQQTDSTDEPTNDLSTYKPRTTISSQLTDTLSNMPVRPEVGGLRNIAAHLAGFGAGSGSQAIVGGQPIGYTYNPGKAKQAEDEVKYGDFDTQLNDWQNKVKALGIGATEEDRANAGEVKRLQGEATTDINQQKVEVARSRADAYQQNADTKIKEEADKHEYSMKKLTDNVASADAKLALAKQNYELKKNSTEAMQAYHNAELASIAARREAQTEDDKFKLEDTKRRTDSIIERNRILNEAHGPTETNVTQQIDPKTGLVTSRRTVKGPLNQNIVTDPTTGHKYDTTSWSEADKAAARAKGWQ